MNLPKLAQNIDSMGLMQKAFVDLSADEITAIVRACLDSVEPTDARRMPYFYTWPEGNRELFIPFDSPESMRSWLKEDGFLALHNVLVALGATSEEMTAYMGPDWSERLKRRWDNPLNHEKQCPMCGTPRKENS